eukprot:jgi/Bigna1/85203/estExt_fgenesh1_pg.C_20417
MVDRTNLLLALHGLSQEKRGRASAIQPNIPTIQRYQSSYQVKGSIIICRADHLTSDQHDGVLLSCNCNLAGGQTSTLFTLMEQMEEDRRFNSRRPAVTLSMWGFGSRKKRIDTLEKYIEELQNSLEEAEVTVATKDEIIKNMLNERKSEEQEIERLNEQILVCLNKIQSEENGYQKATAIKISSAAAGGASAGRFLCPSRRKSGVFGFGSLKKRRGGGNNSNNNNCDNHLLGLPSDSEAVAANGSLTGKLGMSCKVYNLRGKNLNLKLRQGGQTLAGGKSEVIAAVKNPRNTAFSRSRKKKMMAAASKMGSSSSSSTFKYVAKFSQVAVKIPDLDRNLPLEIQVWQKGNFRSKSVAGVNVWIKDLVTLFRNNESAIYEMHRASEMDSNLVSKAQLTIAMDDDMLSQEDIKEKGDLLSSTRKRQRIKVGSSNASSTRTTTASSKGGGKNICLEIEAVRFDVVFINVCMLRKPC